MKVIVLCVSIILIVGCSVVGKQSVEIAPYEVIQTAENESIELRHYNSLVLVSTSMTTDSNDSRNTAFRKLFDYISGDNIDQSKIAMTAPVFMDDPLQVRGTKIPMTAPVFIDENTNDAMMSFVMPADFTLETTPLPTNPDVTLSEVKDYTVAVIRFNGRLQDDNIQTHKVLLENWIADKGYEVTGTYKTAGYNAPFTLPALRRNEILIPVKK